jgi:hypothetical protein
MKVMKIELILEIMLLIFLSFKTSTALADNKVQAQGAAIPCLTCGTSMPSPLPVAILAEADDLIKALDRPVDCDPKSNPKANPKTCLLMDWLKWKHKDYGPSCKEFFIDEKGMEGSYSKLIKTLIGVDIKQNQANSVFYKNNLDFEKLCPEYKNFTTKQKISFHAWNFELLAFPESTCNVNIKPAKGVNTKAVCLYQLEDKPEFRWWRSNGFPVKHCAVSAQEIMTLKGCTSCAFDEYKRKSLKDGTPFGIFDADEKKVSGAYWASFNPLPPSQEACYEKYMDQNTGKPLMKGNKPIFRGMCKGSNNEWIARYKFFKRIQKFPLCGTKLAKKELDGLQAYKDSQVKKGL